MMLRYESLLVVVVILLLAGCAIGGSLPSPKVIEDYEPQRFPSWVPDTESPGAVFLVHGLIDLASEKPDDHPTLLQDHAILVSVNADEPQRWPCQVAKHMPQMYCRENCMFEGPDGGEIDRINLSGVDVTFNERTPDSKVVMNQANLMGTTPDDCEEDQACMRSLRWLPRGELMNPGKLKDGAFGRPDPDLVASQVVFEEGEVFTYNHWGRSGSYCQFNFPNGEKTRAMAKTLGVVVPATDGVIKFQLKSPDGYTNWKLKLIGKNAPAKIELSNLAATPGKHDFTGHNILRDKDWLFCWNVPKFEPLSCRSTRAAASNKSIVALDPQCTPNNNQWPP